MSPHNALTVLAAVSPIRSTRATALSCFKIAAAERDPVIAERLSEPAG
jgi:hypothetical protein